MLLLPLQKKQQGLLSILNEQSTFPKATDMTFIDLVKQNLKEDPYLVFSRQVTAFPPPTTLRSHTPLMIFQATNKFTVHHFAGDVEYTVTDFLRYPSPSLIIPPTFMTCDVMSLLVVRTRAVLGTTFWNAWPSHVIRSFDRYSPRRGKRQRLLWPCSSEPS